MSKSRGFPEVLLEIDQMSTDSTHRFGDSNAAQQRFLSLFLRSEREIFRYVAVLVPNVTDAEDIVQQTAMALWEKFDAYDPSQPFTPWACRFALNKARQWIERRQRWQALLDHGLAEELGQRRQELQSELEQRLKHLEGCLGKLPEGQRSVVEGYYYERASIQTLAQRSGRSEAATYKMLQRIRHALLVCVDGQAKPEVA
jgi:RNA polymerase sigma-70 factor, ECF subfamily